MAIAGEATSFATRPARAFNPSALAGRAKLALLLLLVVLIPWLCLTQPAPPPPAEPDDEAASAAAPVEKTPPESNYIFRKAALAESWEIEEPDPALSTQTLFIIGFLALGTLFFVFKVAPDLVVALKTELKPWRLTPATAAATGMGANIRAEAPAFSEFLEGFKGDPTDADDAAALAEFSRLSDDVKRFFAEAPGRLGEIRKIVQLIERARATDNHQETLSNLAKEIKALREAAGRRELLPIWQLASALEGLIKQLTQQASNFTSSTLRTVVSGVALFDDLCKPGVNSKLLTNPPLRLLAVDDELISRRAVTYSLTKALGKPDVAEEGQTGLAMAMRQPYDLVFLDVFMPGMDGFELYSQIRRTEQNRETPVVFVTSLNDFEARQSILNSGCDLIGKPFLTFEITVKALTLILKRRLKARDDEVKKRKAAKASSPTAAAVAEQQNALATSKSVDPRIIGQYLSKLAPPESPTDEKQPADGASDGSTTPAQNPAPASADANALPTIPKPDEATILREREFLARASKEVKDLQRRIIEIFETPDNRSRMAMLVDFYLDFHGLMPKDSSAPFHPALRLCTRIEALLKKLVEQPRHCTSSTLLTIHTALELVAELCAPEEKKGLAPEVPIRLLVVDDDPVARGAITLALQVAFEKPEAANDGEAAVALGSQKQFDAIFMDIEMPGMDGFTASLKIHTATQNCNTPIVFVTSHIDFKSRTRAAASGASDFISKPFLTAEVTLKALTYALRGRIQKHTIAEALAHSPNGHNGAPHNAGGHPSNRKHKSKHRRQKSSKSRGSQRQAKAKMGRELRR